MIAKNYEDIKLVFERNLKGRCFEGVDINKEIQVIYEEIKTINEEIEAINEEIEAKGFSTKKESKALLEKREKDDALREKVRSMEFKVFCDKFNIPLTFEEYKKKSEEEPIPSIIYRRSIVYGEFDESFWETLLKSGAHEDDGGKRILVFLFKDRFYVVEGTYTWEEARLLVLEDYDKERKKFERLKLLYDSEKVKEDSKSRPPIPEEVKIAVWRRDNGRCVKCGSQENLEYDHIIPVSKGGSNTSRNIQLLCEKCNRQKRDNLV